MLFTTRSGEGVTLEPAAKRQARPVAVAETRLIRAHTWQYHLDRGFSLAAIARYFRISEKTIRADLAELAGQLAARPCGN